MTRATKRLVLVGGGHAHVQVLLDIAQAAGWPGVEVCLVSDAPVAIYSGMASGYIAGEYSRDEIGIPLDALAQRAGASFECARAVRVDRAARRLELADGRFVDYDVAAFDIGSQVSQTLPGAREHALATRPIGRLIDGAQALLERAEQLGPKFRLVVVGGGAGGVELAWVFRARLGQSRGCVALVESGARLLPEHADRVSRRAERLSVELGVVLQLGRRVVRLDADGVRLDDGTAQAADAVIWVTGASAPPLFRDSGLPTDDQGFLRVNPQLQSLAASELFAAGDAAHLEAEPQTAKAGVYAVRAGPVLSHNLRVALSGGSPRAFTPQRDYLAILNLGDGRAFATKWGFAAVSRGVRRVKHRLDCSFVERYR